MPEDPHGASADDPVPPGISIAPSQRAEASAALRVLRAYRQLPLAELAERSGLAEADLALYERGDEPLPAETLPRILRGLDMTRLDWRWALDFITYLQTSTTVDPPPEIPASDEQVLRMIDDIARSKGRDQEVVLRQLATSFMHLIFSVQRGHQDDD